MRPVRLGALALFALFAVFAVAPGVSAASRQDPDGFTPIVSRVVAPPWPVEGSDGRFHLVYEVQLLNTIPVPWRVTGATVRSATGRGRALASWTGPRVRDVMRSLADGRDARRIGPGEGALLHLTFSARTRSRLPTSLVHELRLANPDPTNGAPIRVVEIGARAKLVRRAPAVLGPPLQGDRWLAADGCCLARRHVRAFQPYGGGLFTAQRFAIDWERLDPSGRLFVGDKRVLSSWQEQPHERHHGRPADPPEERRRGLPRHERVPARRRRGLPHLLHRRPWRRGARVDLELLRDSAPALSGMRASPAVPARRSLGTSSESLEAP